jgi:NAD(P)-dependent dehydrogenase (short-subunit alcohol dehydrogenase family)
MTELRFDGRVAIITGAGGGLGRSHALELARRGAQVVVNDLGGALDGSGSSATAAQHVVDEIAAFGGVAVANHDSVSTPEGGAAIVGAAIDAFGRVDVLVNNAGILRDKAFHKMDTAMIDSVIDVHLKGAFYVSQPAFRLMREQGYGRIVNTSSASGLFGNFGQANYGAAKAASPD